MDTVFSTLKLLFEGPCQPYPAVFLRVSHDQPMASVLRALPTEERDASLDGSKVDISKTVHHHVDEEDDGLNINHGEQDDELHSHLDVHGPAVMDDVSKVQDTTTSSGATSDSAGISMAAGDMPCQDKYGPTSSERHIQSCKVEHVPGSNSECSSLLCAITFNPDCAIQLSIPAVNNDGTMTIPVLYRPVTGWHSPTRVNKTKRHRLSITIKHVEGYPWLALIIHQVKTAFSTPRSMAPFLHLITHILKWNSVKCKNATSMSSLFETVEMLEEFELTLEEFGYSRQRAFMTVLSKLISLSQAMKLGDPTVLAKLSAYVSSQVRELRAVLQIGRDTTTDTVLAGQQQWLTEEQFQGLHAVVACVSQGTCPNRALSQTVEYAEFARDCLILFLSFTIGMQRSQVWRNIVVTSDLSKHSHSMCLYRCSATKFIIHINHEKNSLARGTHRVLHITGNYAAALDRYMTEVRTQIVGLDSNCALVFPARHGKPLTQPMLCIRLQFILYALFGVNLTPQLTRKVFESHFLHSASSPEDLRSITENFGNESITAALNYRVPIDPRTDQHNGWHPVFKWLTTVPAVEETDRVWVHHNLGPHIVCEDKLWLHNDDSPSPQVYSGSQLLLKIPVQHGWTLCLPTLSIHGTVDSPKRWIIKADRAAQQSPFKRARTTIPSVLKVCSECPALAKIMDHVLASRVSVSAKAELKSSLKHLCWKAELKEASTILELFPEKSASLQSLESLHELHSDGTMRNIMQAGIEACKAYRDLNLVSASRRGELACLEEMFKSRYLYFRSQQGRRRYMLCHDEHTLPRDSPVHHVHFAGAFNTCLQVLVSLSDIPRDHTDWTIRAVCYHFQRCLFVCIFLAVAPLPTAVYERITLDHVHIREATGMFEIDFPLSKGHSDVAARFDVPSQLTKPLQVFLSVARKTLSTSTGSLFCSCQDQALSSSELTLMFKATFFELWGFSLCPSDARIAVKAWIEKHCEGDLTSAHTTQIRNRLGLAFSTLTKHTTTRASLTTPWCAKALKSACSGTSDSTQISGTTAALSALHHAQQSPAPHHVRSARLAFIRNVDNSCLEDSFVACMASALQFVSVEDIATDPAHVRQFYHVSKLLLQYWRCGEAAILRDVQQSMKSLRSNVNTFITRVCATKSSHAVPPSAGQCLELANWLKCFGVSEHDRHSFMTVAEAKLVRETRCINNHTLVEPVQGTATFEFFKQTKRKGADLYWYMEPGGLGVDGVNTVYGQEGMILACPTCKSGAIRTWKFERAPHLLFVEIGGVNTVYPYNSAPFTVEVLGHLYRLVAIIQNRKNSHFRALVEISGTWSICDDLEPEHTIRLPTLSTQSPSATWKDGLHVFARIGTCPSPKSAAAMDLESVRHAVAAEQQCKTLHGLGVAIRRMICSSEKEKHDAMGSLLTSYTISMEEVLQIIHDPQALKASRKHMNDVIATMARKLYNIIRLNEEGLNVE